MDHEFSGEDACENLIQKIENNEEPYDIVFMDMDMP